MPGYNGAGNIVLVPPDAEDNHDGILLGLGRSSAGGFYWQDFGGARDQGESALITARREAQEETGLAPHDYELAQSAFIMRKGGNTYVTFVGFLHRSARANVHRLLSVSDSACELQRYTLLNTSDRNREIDLSILAPFSLHERLYSDNFLGGLRTFANNKADSGDTEAKAGKSLRRRNAEPATGPVPR